MKKEWLQRLSDRSIPLSVSQSFHEQYFQVNLMNERTNFINSNLHKVELKIFVSIFIFMSPKVHFVFSSRSCWSYCAQNLQTLDNNLKLIIVGHIIFFFCFQISQQVPS